MAYATEAQMQVAAGGAARMVQLLDWDADGSVDAAVLAQCQAEVDSLINSYIAPRYEVPLESPSSAFVAMAAAEYVYWAREKRGGVSEDDRKGHEERLAWLKMAGAGKVQVRDPVPTKSGAIKSAWVDRDEDDVSRANLEGFS